MKVSFDEALILEQPLKQPFSQILHSFCTYQTLIFYYNNK